MDQPRQIVSHDDLEALYPQPVASSVTKEVDRILDGHRRLIEAAPFVVLATAGPGGLDCSPRGDPGGWVRVADDRTLLLPDRRGNNRLDSLRNIIDNGQVGLLFMIPGIGITLRVNGAARILCDEALNESFAIDGKIPATVVEVTVHAVYTQCPKAIIRSGLWDADAHRDPAELPTVGNILDEITGGTFGGADYDASYPERLRETIY